MNSQTQTTQENQDLQCKTKQNSKEKDKMLTLLHIKDAEITGKERCFGVKKGHEQPDCTPTKKSSHRHPAYACERQTDAKET